MSAAALELPKPTLTDFGKLIAELEATGLTSYKIATCLGIQLTQLDRIKAGSEPKYSVGVTLVALHEVLVLTNL